MVKLATNRWSLPFTSGVGLSKLLELCNLSILACKIEMIIEPIW